LSEKYQFTVDTTGIRLDHFLSAKLPRHSRSKIQTYIKKAFVTVDKKTAKSSQILKGGEIIECAFQVPDERSLEPQDVAFSILYEDDALAVINKPAGLVVHPGNGNPDHTLVNGLLYHFRKLSAANPVRPGIVHRLDKDTSGVMVIAKTDFAHDHISRQFANRSVCKIYKALVWGKLDPEGEITGLLDRDPRNRILFRLNPVRGRNSVTRFFRDEYYAPFSLATLKPQTGRTHQLRVHLKHIGHPILGDSLYAGGISLIKSYHQKFTPVIKSVFNNLNRLALHAWSLEIDHPETGERMHWTAPMPEEFEKVIMLLSHA